MKLVAPASDWKARGRRVLLRLQYSANRSKWISSTEAALYVRTEQQYWTSHNEVPLAHRPRCQCLCVCQHRPRRGNLRVCQAHCGNPVCGACLVYRDPPMCHYCVYTGDRSGSTCPRVPARPLRNLSFLSPRIQQTVRAFFERPGFEKDFQIIASTAGQDFTEAALPPSMPRSNEDLIQTSGTSGCALV